MTHKNHLRSPVINNKLRFCLSLYSLKSTNNLLLLPHDNNKIQLKRFNMRKGLFYISSFLIFTLFLSSCVSKKKYEELARAKRSVDREAATLENDKKTLEAEIQKLKNDFNAVRYQLTANNAAKDKQIDDLNTQLRTLQNKESALKSELKDVSEQVKSKVKNSEGQLAELQSQLARTMEERDQIKKQLADYKTNADWDNRKLNNEVEHIKSSLKFKDSEIARLEKEIAGVKKQVTDAKNQLAKKTQEVEKLTNQVKKELGK